MKVLILILILILLIILLVRYLILIQYRKPPAPEKDGSLCPDIFDLYELNVPFLEIPENAYAAIPSYVEKSGFVLAITNEGELQYRLEGLLIWSSENPEKVNWTSKLKQLYNLSSVLASNALSKTLIESIVKEDDSNKIKKTETIQKSGEFILSLNPLCILREGEDAVWSVQNGWAEDFRPQDEFPTGQVLLISDNRKMQLGLLSSGDLIVIEKSSLSTPPRIVTSLLKSYC
jgi:hypothetical protein